MEDEMESMKETNETPERFDEIEIDFMKIFFIIKRHKWLIMSIIVICIIIGEVNILKHTNSVSACKVALTFNGIDKHEYPDGQKFEMNDLIPSDATTEVAKIIQNPDKRKIFEKNPRAFLFVDPYIPIEVQVKANEMKKVEKKTMFFLPNQYYVRFIQKLGGPFDGRERTLILYGLIQTFERRFYDDFVNRPLLTVQLSQDQNKQSDYIDSFEILNNIANNYMGFLDKKIEVAGYYRSVKTGKSFVDLQTELKNMMDIDLLGVDSLIYYYHLSKYKDFLLTKTQYRVRQMEKEREKKMMESEMANNLLKQVLEKDKSRSTTAMPMGTPSSQIVVDADTIEKLNQKEYLNLLIKRSLESGVESQNLGVDKKYLQEYIDLLQKSQGKEIDVVSAKDFVEKRLEIIRLELERIAKTANDLNQEYMLSRYSNVVMITEEPHNYKQYDMNPAMMIALSIFAGIVISLGLVFIFYFISAGPKKKVCRTNL
jgi:hypothetical protein